MCITLRYVHLVQSQGLPDYFEGRRFERAAAFAESLLREDSL